MLLCDCNSQANHNFPRRPFPPELVAEPINCVGASGDTEAYLWVVLVIFWPMELIFRPRGWFAEASCGNITLKKYGIFLDLFAQKSVAVLDRRGDFNCPHRHG